MCGFCQDTVKGLVTTMADAARYGTAGHAAVSKYISWLPAAGRSKRHALPGVGELASHSAIGEAGHPQPVIGDDSRQHLSKSGPCQRTPHTLVARGPCSPHCACSSPMARALTGGGHLIMVHCDAAAWGRHMLAAGQCAQARPVASDDALVLSEGSAHLPCCLLRYVLRAHPDRAHCGQPCGALVSLSRAIHAAALGRVHWPASRQLRT